MDDMTPSEAADMLLEQYGDEIYRYVRFTVGNKSDADDLIQEVFLRVIQGWKRFNHSSNSKTWLWAIAKNCIREHYRKQKRHSVVTTLNDMELLDHHSVDALTEVMIAEVLQRIPIPQREAFIERIVNERTTSETAQVLGWSESKVRTTLHRAIASIRKIYQKGDERSAGTRY